MSLLIFSYRRQQIIAQKNAISLRLMQLQKQYMDYQQYASSIADGTVSLNDLMSVPSSLFNRMSIFMQYSHQQSYANAQQQMAYVRNIPGAIPQMSNDATQNAQLQQQYTQAMFKQFYDQGRQQAAEKEKKLLDTMDTKIEQEKATLETQLQMLTAEEKTVSEAESKAAEASAPKYA